MVPEDSYATVMCEVVRTRPASLVPELDLCPRLALAKVMHKAMEVHGLSFLVKFEVEVEVVKVSADGNEIIPHSTGFGQFAIAGQEDPCFAHMEECICELQYVGIDIEGFQLQGRRGRYQISLHPQQPLQAVDELLLVHDRIKRIFSKYSYIATMCPKPVAARQQTTSQHMHISISPPDAESSFLAGVLKHLQALCAFSLPYDLSYEREQLNSEVVAWGTQNWGVPIRKVNSGHWDIRCVDATANMYLTLAAFLGAGLSGIQNQESLIWPDISISERLDAVKAGPAAYLPSSLEDALCFLEAEAGEIEGIIESKIVHHYVLLKRFESSRMRQDLEEARRLHVVVF